MTLTPLLLLGAASFLIATMIVGAMTRYARRSGVIDVPNHRSSHSVPTPRGGGVGIVVAVAATLSMELARLPVEHGSYIALTVVAVAVLAAVGWSDDRGKSSISARMAMHLISGLAMAALINRIAPLAGWMNAGWLLWWFFWTIASINIVNFMDGIDGMVASQGLIYGVYVALLAGTGSFGFTFGILLACACFGFLVWNWAPARIFMGDAGSGPLGLLFVLGGALALGNSRASLIFLPLLPLYLDALVTMLIRARRGERLTNAHRTHLYQRIVNAGVGHATVTLGYAAAALAGVVIGLALRHASPRTTVLAVVAYSLLSLCLWKALDSAHARPSPANQAGAGSGL